MDAVEVAEPVQDKALASTAIVSVSLTAVLRFVAPTVAVVLVGLALLVKFVAQQVLAFLLVEINSVTRQQKQYKIALKTARYVVIQCAIKQKQYKVVHWTVPTFAETKYVKPVSRHTIVLLIALIVVTEYAMRSVEKMCSLARLIVEHVETKYAKVGMKIRSLVLRTVGTAEIIYVRWPKEKLWSLVQ